MCRAKANWAALGLLNRSSITADKLNKNIFKISQMYTHPKYKPTSAYADVVLYKLENAIIFTPSIRPICLYASNEKPSISYLPATIAGWGPVDTGKDNS